MNRLRALFDLRRDKVLFYATAGIWAGLGAAAAIYPTRSLFGFGFNELVYLAAAPVFATIIAATEKYGVWHAWTVVTLLAWVIMLTAFAVMWLYVNLTITAKPGVPIILGLR